MVHKLGSIYIYITCILRFSKHYIEFTKIEEFKTKQKKNIFFFYNFYNSYKYTHYIYKYIYSLILDFVWKEMHININTSKFFRFQ